MTSVPLLPLFAIAPHTSYLYPALYVIGYCVTLEMISGFVCQPYCERIILKVSDLLKNPLIATSNKLKALVWSAWSNLMHKTQR